MLSKLHTQRLLAWFAVAALLFNFPLQQWALGRIWLVFAVWALVIVGVAWLSERAVPDEAPSGAAAPPGRPPDVPTHRDIG
jgi:hypothetical protein